MKNTSALWFLSGGLVFLVPRITEPGLGLAILITAAVAIITALAIDNN